MNDNGTKQPAPDQRNMLLAGCLAIFALMALVWSLPPLTGRLPDPDDYLRMERVFAILDGKHLPSYAAPGLGIGGTAETGWSRLIDWPVAAVQAVAELFADRIQAAMVTATIMPALALLCFVFAAAWYGRALLGGKWRAPYTLLAVLLLWGLLRQFMPGRVDHHMWQAVLAVIAYGALARIYFAPERRLYPVLVGIVFGTGLEIGVDIIPPLAFGTALLGLFWVARGRVFARAGLWYGGTLFGMALAWHLLLHDHGRFFTVYCDALSPAWLTLAAAVLAFWGLVLGLPESFKAGWRGRVACGMAVSTPLLAALYLMFPACFHDPYQIAAPAVRAIWLQAVSEAQPFPALWTQKPGAAFFLAFPPLLALLASLWAMREERENRLLWGGLAFVLACSFALGFYQVRTLDAAQAIAVGPLSWLLAVLAGQGGALVRRLSLSRGQRLAAAALFFAAMLALFGLSLSHKAQTVKTAGTLPACDVRKAAAFLQTLPAPLTIAAHIDIGPELLFRTDHHVLAGPYHRDEAGIAAIYNIFTAPDATRARAEVAASGADILMLCQWPESLWTSGKAGEKVFATSLAHGQVPGWLHRIGTAAQTGNYLIFGISPAARGK